MKGVTFYGYDALQQRSLWPGLWRYAIIALGIILIAGYFIVRLRHQNLTKYRDLLIIIELVVLLTIGIQARDIQSNRNAFKNSQAVTTLMSRIAKARNLKRNEIYASDDRMYTGLLIQFQRREDQTYVVTMDPNGKSYQLNPTQLIDDDVQYVDK